jgi:hypothetical protein
MNLPRHLRLLSVLLCLAPCLPLGAQDLLLRPSVKFNGTMRTAPQSYWGVANQGKGSFEFTSENNTLVTRMWSTEGTARLQLGAAGVPAATLKEFAGRTVRISALVSGRIETLADDGGLGPVLQVEFSGKNGRALLATGPHLTESNSTTLPPRVEGMVGDVPPTRLEIVTRVPRNTEKLIVLCYLMNATGELEWREVKAEIVPERILTHPAPADFAP